MPQPRSREPRRLRVSLALSERERRGIRRRAHLAGLTVSEFLRRSALGIEIRPRPQRITLDALYEVRRIGKNLNQIARMVSDPTRLAIAGRAEEAFAQLVEWIRLHAPEDRRARRGRG